MSSAERTSELPLIEGPRGPRSPFRAVAVAVAGALAVGGLGFVLLRDDSRQARVEKLGPAPSTTPATAVPPTTSQAAPATSQVAPPTTAGPRATTTTSGPERLSTASRISLDGIGPVDIGMTLDEASAAAGVPIRVRPNQPFENCAFARPDGAEFDGLAFMVINGRIERVDGHGPFKTVSGMGVGNTEADVFRTYGDRIRVEGHAYVRGGHYLVYTPNDPGLQHLSLLFETDGERVTTFRAGLRGAVASPEGCA